MGIVQRGEGEAYGLRVGEMVEDGLDVCQFLGSSFSSLPAELVRAIDIQKRGAQVVVAEEFADVVAGHASCEEMAGECVAQRVGREGESPVFLEEA